MIVCPECEKEIADDSAHCGYCGAEIESGAGKKTMIGMAPVTAEMMAQAAAEAKAARQAREASLQPEEPEEKSLGDLISEGKLNIPKPRVPDAEPPASSGLPSPGKLSIPKIGGATSAPSAPGSDAKTEMMESVGGAPSTIEEQAAPSTPPASMQGGSSVSGDFRDTAPSQPEALRKDLATANEGFKMSSTDPPAGRGAQGAQGEPAWAGGPAPAEKTMPEVKVLGGGGGDGPSSMGGDGPVVISGNTLPAKKSNTAIYAVLAAVVLFGMCCVGAVLFGLLGGL